MERIHQLEGDREELLLDLDEIARAGARKMLAQALEAEVPHYTRPVATAAAVAYISPSTSATDLFAPALLPTSR